ncbi:hypothetical protein Bca52824_063343 [Brassica carinata]|uniref:Uncharacterized protein n=1 Tax=Brassica carinata TaxID=52824 RepID=A0A8X7QIS0_BRACI|nr:hypothetical protein Bca52824_063343 [Brassica carinata]
MEGPKKRRPLAGDGNDEAEIFWSDSKKHKKNNGDGFSDDEMMRMHDNHCDGRTPNASGKRGDESPISGLNLLAEEVEKGTRSDNVYKDPQENTCRMLTVWSHPESYVLPPEEQGGKASPTNSEDYKTPPEDDPMTESRTPTLGIEAESISTSCVFAALDSSHLKKTKHFHGCVRTIFTSTKGLATVDHARSNSEMHAADTPMRIWGRSMTKGGHIPPKYAMDTYEEFIGNIKVQSDG